MNPFFMQIWIESFRVALEQFYSESANPELLGYKAALFAEAACQGAQRAANDAKAKADRVVKP